jgi:hypothetical protein
MLICPAITALTQIALPGARINCRGHPETGRHPPAWNWVFFEPLM